VAVIPRGLHIAQSDDEFAACWSIISSLVDPAVRLPDWPFLLPRGQVDIAEFDRLLADDFVPVLQALARTPGDDNVILTVVDPEASYYRNGYAHYPGRRFESPHLAQRYWDGLTYVPSGDPTGAIFYTADVVAVAGSSGTWAVWGERDWDLVLVHSQTVNGPWLDVGVPFLGGPEALREFTAPDWGDVHLPERERSTFLRNLDERGRIG
jgi:hypothetical protein